MKKTALLATHFPPAVGGTPTLYYNLCKKLDPQQIVVITQKFEGWEEFDRQQHFSIYRLDRFCHLDCHIFSEIFRLQSIFRREGIEQIIFGHINFCLTSLIFHFLFRHDYYLYAHGDEISRNYGGNCYQFFKWNALRYAKKIIVVSDFTKSLIEPYNSHIEVIYNAVDAKEFTPQSKDPELVKKHGVEKKQVLITISRLEDRKGHDTVIKILPQLIEKFPQVKYLIGGTGEQMEPLRRLIDQLQLQSYVELIGEIPAERLIDYYNLADIFVMPVRSMPDGNTEGFGIVFLEANACGKPVIGGNSGGVSSAIQDGYNGFLINGHRPQELYKAIARLLEDATLRRQMGRNALEWVTHFTYDRMIQKLKRVLDE